MNEQSLPEQVTQAEQDTVQESGLAVEPTQQPAETANGNLEQRDQEQVTSLVDQVVLQYKQALRENRQRHAQEILDAARRQPEIAELIAPKLQQVEQAQRDMDKLKEETAATFRIIGTMLGTFSQDRRNMHALNPNQATDLLAELRRMDKQLATAQDINAVTNTLILLGDWAENTVRPALNRTAQRVAEYSRGTIPPAINEEGVRLQRLAATYIDARTRAATIRRNFDAI